MTRVLTIDAAMARVSVALADADGPVACRIEDGGRGLIAGLADMARAVFDAACVAPTGLDLVAVTVGPGSFTGLRAALALAHGIGLAANCPVIGVTTVEALAEAAGPCDGRPVWVAIDSRRGRIFLHDGASLAPCRLDALPLPRQPIAVAGDQAIEVVARLAARDANVMLTRVRLPAPADIARVALCRHAGLLAPLAAQPLYVDPPEAKLPAGGLRPPPQDGP
jgi:tRNA threonylcarbamoyladenosine biosynthesis protein TsaB